MAPENASANSPVSRNDASAAAQQPQEMRGVARPREVGKPRR